MMYERVKKRKENRLWLFCKIIMLMAIMLENCLGKNIYNEYKTWEVYIYYLII